MCHLLLNYIFNRLAFENQKRQKYGRIVSNKREALECFIEQESENGKAM